MLQTLAVNFLKSEVPKERVLEIDESPNGFSEELWRQMVRMEWTGMAIPEEFGGTGNSWTDLGVIYEALGEACCPSPHLSTVLCSQVILETGAAAQHKDLLSSIAKTGHVLSFCYTEPEYGWEPEHIRLSANRSNGDYVLNGTKLFVADANIADQLLVVARTSSQGSPENGISVFLVDRKASGVSVRRHVGWMSENLSEIELSNVSVPASAVIGEVGGAWGAIERARDRATAVLSLYMAGGARRVMDMAIEYSKSRILYGVPIGTFQRVQDHVILGVNHADAIKWSAYEALWKLDEGKSDAPVSVSMAKAAASVGFPQACEESHHVHAGVGTDFAYGLVQYTKKARTLQHYLGDAIYHKKRMASLLQLDQPPEESPSG